jgi:HEAT repeat protein
MNETDLSEPKSTFLRDILAAAARERSAWYYVDEETARSLIAAGINSREELVGRLPSLQGELLFAALHAVALLRLRRAGRALVTLITSGGAAARGVAQAACSAVRPRRWYGALGKLATGPVDVAVGVSAAHALSFTFDSAAAAPHLLAIFERAELHPSIRAQAAEGLGNTLGYSDGRRTLFRRAAKSLIASLSSESPELRFWCCFALGQMHVHQAIPALKRVAAEDSDFCPGWWLVSEEASDALLWIAGKRGPDRLTFRWTGSGPKVPPGFDEHGHRIA